MIQALTLRNFKCFDDLKLSMALMTVLSGFNAAGKSTAVQGLLLITQTLRTDPSSVHIPLNGNCLELGTPGDVIREGGRATNELQIGFATGGFQFDWALLADDRTMGLALRSKSIVVTAPDTSKLDFDNLAQLLEPASTTIDGLRESFALLQQLVVINTQRPTCTDVFPAPHEGLPTYANVGINGQYAAWWFNHLADEEIDIERCHPSDSARTLRRQFAAWAGTLFPGAQANVVHLPRTNLFRLELRIGETDDWRRPANIGYGLSYAFPILVAGLAAKKGQILYIDSPEAHLHPAAQSAMGQFLGRLAQSGVQIVVETHSDHVMNGMRLAVRNGTLSQDNVLFHFFSRSADRAVGTLVETIGVDASGRMSAWPAGFFDQIEKDLALL